MVDQNSVPTQGEERPLYVKGYFSDRIWSGETPKYGYPSNHVPATTFATMKVETGFVLALKAGK